MLTFLTYKTPAKFLADFKEFYSIANLKQIKILSIILLLVSSSSRILSLFFYEGIIKIPNYAEHSLNNWFQLFGSIIFYFLSVWAIGTKSLSEQNRRAITFIFIIFILLITLGVSYSVSLHNTKNTLMMFLTGIVTVSLFFSIEFRELCIITIFIEFVFMISIVLPKISFQEKFTNILAGLILGFLLLSFSRYSYYFKSQHFVRLKQLEEKNLEIERLNNQKGEILAFVAHDLRSPLNNIEMLSGFLIEENLGSGEAEMILKSAKHAKEIIKDLLEVAKLDQSNLSTEYIEIVPYLDSVIDKWKINSKRKIILNGIPNLYVNIDVSKFERVMDNLISNGLKFSRENEAIEINLKHHGDKICIVVKDYGIGIPENMQELVFNQFSTAGRKGLNGENSIGLGLHISKKIIEQHHGKLLMKSKENEGTTFTILLPIC